MATERKASKGTRSTKTSVAHTNMREEETDKPDVLDRNQESEGGQVLAERKTHDRGRTNEHKWGYAAF